MERNSGIQDLKLRLERFSKFVLWHVFVQPDKEIVVKSEAAASFYCRTAREIEKDVAVCIKSLLLDASWPGGQFRQTMKLVTERSAGAWESFKETERQISEFLVEIQDIVCCWCGIPKRRRQFTKVSAFSICIACTNRCSREERRKGAAKRKFVKSKSAKVKSPPKPKAAASLPVEKPRRRREKIEGTGMFRAACCSCGEIIVVSSATEVSECELCLGLPKSESGFRHGFDPAYQDLVYEGSWT